MSFDKNKRVRLDAVEFVDGKVNLVMMKVVGAEYLESNTVWFMMKFGVTEVWLSGHLFLCTNSMETCLDMDETFCDIYIVPVVEVLHSLLVKKNQIC